MYNVSDKWSCEAGWCAQQDHNISQEAEFTINQAPHRNLRNKAHFSHAQRANMIFVPYFSPLGAYWRQHTACTVARREQCHNLRFRICLRVSKGVSICMRKCGTPVYFANNQQKPPWPQRKVGERQTGRGNGYEVRPPRQADDRRWK